MHGQRRAARVTGAASVNIMVTWYSALLLAGQGIKRHVEDSWCVHSLQSNALWCSDVAIFSAVNVAMSGVAHGTRFHN